jgi:hypothetical protein
MDYIINKKKSLYYIHNKNEFMILTKYKNKKNKFYIVKK